MDENNKPTAVSDEERDEALFHAIGRDKKKKKIRRIVTIVVILALLAGGVTAAVLYGRNKIRQQVVPDPVAQVVTYTVETGSVVTTVGGSGLLADVDSEKIVVPAGVTVEELLVAPGQRVEEGQALATVDLSTVMAALDDTQDKITELDGKLREASDDAVGGNITAGVNGRVKKIYADVGDDVAGCMMENGALALLSLDGYMAADIETDALTEGQEILVVRPDGRELKGLVDGVASGKATVLVTDDGPALDEEVTVRTPEGEEIGGGTLYIHDPLRVTGYAGTVSAVRTAENRYVWAGNNLFSLKDTAYSANYEMVLKERREREEDLLKLLDIQSVGTVNAPFAGTVSSVEYKDPDAPQEDPSGGEDPYGGLSAYGGTNSYGGTGSYGAGGSSTGQTGGEEENAAVETPLVTLAKDEQMSVTFGVDELDILSLEIGQDVQVTVNSIGDEVFSGTVTEINRSGGNMESGGANYTATVTMPKDKRMISGMSAKVVVRIQSVAGSVLIPEQALHQTRDEAFVYTAYDEKTGELTEPKPVISGLSDGEMVEIVEGLSQGDTIYYMEEYNPFPYIMGYSSDGDATWVEDGVDVDGETVDGDATDGDATDGETADGENAENGEDGGETAQDGGSDGVAATAQPGE